MDEGYELNYRKCWCVVKRIRGKWRKINRKIKEGNGQPMTNMYDIRNMSGILQ